MIRPRNSKPNQRRQAPRRQQSRRLFLEPLEARVVLSTITVTTLADSVADDGACSLREAITAANTNISSGAMANECTAGDPDGDRIEFNASVAGGTATLIAGQLPIEDDVVIDGAHPSAVADITVHGNNASGVFVVDASGGVGVNRDVELANLNITGGNGVTGSGITVTGSTLHVNSSSITGNQADIGGGINIAIDSNVTITDSTVSGNTADLFGGGITSDGGTLIIENSTISDNTVNSFGGGIFSGATTTIRNSTIANNRQLDDGAISSGGGAYLGSGVSTIENSTISGNSAARGAGVFIEAGGPLNLESVTIANNTARTNGGGVVAAGVVANNSIFGDNTAVTSPDFEGSFSTATFNLLEDSGGASGIADGVNGNIVGQDPQLGPLQNNGGTTDTHLPQSASPARDNGSTTLALDQRGVARVAPHDIGSVSVFSNSLVLQLGPNLFENATLALQDATTAIVFDTDNPGSPITITGVEELIIEGSANDNRLTVDYANGDPLSVFGEGVVFNGNDQVTGDSLALINGATQTVTHTFLSQNDGSARVENGAPTATIQYTGLEPILDNLSAVDRVFTFPVDASNDAILLNTGDVSGDNTSRIASLASSEMVDFRNPSNSLTINAGSGDDTITVQHLDNAQGDQGPAPHFELRVNGEEGQDDLVVDHGAASGGVVNRVIHYDGGATGEGNTLVVTGAPDNDILRETYIVGDLATAGTGDAAEDDGIWVLDPDDSAAFSAAAPNVLGTLRDPASANTGTLNQDEMIVYFQNLDPVDTDVPAVLFDVVLTVNADDLTVEDGGQLNGFDSTRVLDNAGTFETFRFANKVTARLNGLDGTDTMTVNHPNASNNLDNLELYGHDITGTDLTDDAARDRFFVFANSADYVTSIRGGMGNDEIHIGDPTSPNRSLDGIAGAVNVFGEEHETDDAPTHAPLQIGCGDPDSSGSLYVGDTLIINDHDDDTANNQYDLSASTFQRTDTALVTYTNIETVELNASLGQRNTINVANTLAGGTTTINAGAALDTITITDTGADSNVTVNALAGDDVINILDTGEDGGDPHNADGDNDLGSFLVVSGSAGADRIVLQGNGQNSRVQLNGFGAADTIEIWATATDSQTQVDGGIENDIIHIGNPTGGNRTLDPILGTICVDGGDHETGPTHDPLQIGCGVPDSSGSLYVGDTLIINDQDDDTADNVYDLSASTFQRTGTALVTYTNIETVELNAALTQPNTINVTNTVAGGTTTINGGAGVDTITITDTGADSHVTVNALGEADVINILDTGIDGDDSNNADGNNDLGSFLIVNGGTENDQIILQSNGDASRVQLNGQAGRDTIEIWATATDSETEVNGGDDNDTIHVGNPNAPNRTLDPILGTICVDGGDHETGPTHDPLQIGCGVPDSSGSLYVGDTLIINDQDDDTADNVYDLSASTFQRTGTALVTYTNIETVELNAALTQPNTINVTNTVAGGTTTINGGAGVDTITITDTGADSHVTVNALGEADVINILDTGIDGDDSNNADGNNDLGSFLIVNGGTENDQIILQGNGDASRVQLNGQAGRDTIEIWATATDSETEVNGGDDNDTIHVGNPNAPNRTLDPILGTICVDGGDHETGPTHDPLQIGCGVPDSSGSLYVGDTLIINDQDDDTADNVYDLSASTFQRTGTALVTYTNIETVELNAALTQPNTINVTNTVAGGTTTINGGAGVDTITITDTGADSHVTVNALGEADVINILDTGIDGDDSNNADGDNDLGSFLIVNGGTENDQIILQGNGDASRVQLNGQAGRDTIEIWATATDSETEVNGGDDNDTIHVGNPNAPNRTLDPILGTICVDGGDHETGPTHDPLQIGCGVPDSSGSLYVGDTLIINDQDDDTADNVYDLSASTFQRTGTALVTYTNIETVELNAALTQPNTINVANTVAGGTTTINGGAGVDTITITDTGADSHVTVNALGEADVINILDTGIDGDDSNNADGNNDLGSFLIVNGGTENDQIILQGNGDASRVQLNGQAGRDTIEIWATATDSETEVNGGDDNDTIHVGNPNAPNRTLDPILGTICVDGGDHETGPTHDPLQIGCGVPDSSGSLYVGDTLIINDQDDDTADNVYDLSASTFQRTGTALVTYTNIETVELNAALTQPNTINVTNTVAGGTTTINGGAGVDTITITDTGADSHVTVNALGEADVINILDTGIDGDDSNNADGNNDLGSFLIVNGGTENDQIILQGNGDASRVQLNGQAGRDTIEIWATATDSETEVNGGDDNDTIHVGNPNAPNRTLDPILGTICVDGGDHETGPTHDPLQIGCGVPDSSGSLYVGDTLIINDQDDDTADNVYDLSASTFQRTGTALVTYTNIETVELNAALTQPNTINVTNTVAGGTTTINGGAGVDTITITDTGADSHVTVNALGEADVINILDTGIDGDDSNNADGNNDLGSFLIVNGGTENDQIILQGNGDASRVQLNGQAGRDTIEIWATATDSETEVNGGDDNDTIHVGNPNAPNRTLDPILGTICVDGGDHETGPTHDPLQIGCGVPDSSGSLYVGDTLIINDQDDDTADNVYDLSASTFQRTGTALVTYTNIETVELNAALTQPNTINVTNTVAGGTTTINGGAGVDTITITDTGADSHVTVNALGEADVINILDTGIDGDDSNNADGNNDLGSFLIVNGGTENDQIILQGNGDASRVQLNGQAGRDTIEIWATATDSETEVNGGDDNDTIHVGNPNAPNRTLDPILGTICVDGGDHETGPTHDPLQIGCGVPDSSGSLYVGDTLIINDQDDDTADNVYDLSASTFQRTGTALVTYTNIETVELNAALTQPNTINVANTVAGGTTTINGGAGVDTITITDTGADSHVTVNALGEADVINILDTGIDGDDSNNADGNNDLGSFLIVNGGTENDQIILQGNGDASRVQLNGQAGRDTIEIWATATDSETEVNGGDDNDTIHVGNPNAPNRTLDPILGTICVDGGDHETGPTHDPLQIGCGVPDSSGSLYVGDTLIINDHDDDTADNVYDLSASTFQRTGTALVTYTNIETVELNAALTQPNTINVANTVAGGTTTINGGAGVDTITITDTGADSHVTVNALGEADVINILDTGIDGDDSNNADGNNDLGSFLIVNGGTENDQIILQGNGDASRVQLNGQAGRDTIEIWATATDSETEVNGGDDNDTIHVGNPNAPNRTLDPILGTICVDGGDHETGPTHDPLQIGCGVPDSSGSLYVGDTLIINDQDDDTADNVYDLSASTFQRTGTALVTYTNIETVELNAALTQPNTINVANTVAGGTTTINGGAGVDTITITDTGADSHVTVNALGEADVINILDTGIDGDDSNNADGNNDLGSFLIVNGGTENDQIILQGNGDASRVQLNGQAGRDTIEIWATATDSETEVNGGDDNDTIHVGNPNAPNRTLDPILGTICVDGGDHETGPTHDPLQIGCGVPDSSGSLYVGDTLIINDQDDDTADNVYDLSASTFQRTGTALVTYTNIETVELNAALTQPNTINVANTVAGGTTTINGGAGVDTITITDTGADSHVTVNALGEADVINILDTGIDGDDSNNADGNNDLGSFLIVNGGTENDQIILQGNGDASRVQLNGQAGRDTIEIWATATDSETEVNGGDDNDTIHVGNPNAPNRTLDPILGTICVDGGDHETGPTHDPLQIGCGVPDSSGSLYVGDTLIINDQDDDTADNVYDLSASTFQRTGTALVTYTNIETVELNAALTQPNTINVTNTVAGGTTTINGGAGVDTITITDTGADSHVTVNALGEADVINILDTGIDGDDSNNADGNNDLGSFLIVNGGTENDQIILQGNGDASRVQLNGQAGRDTIEIWATATDSETEVNGGDDNDTIHVGNPNAPNRTLDPILGTICVDGGDHETGPTHDPLQIGCGVPDSSGSLYVGDTLIINDQDDDTADNVYDLSASTFQRTGTALVTYTNIETVELNAALTQPNTINVANTVAGGTTTINGGAGVDTITITDTGADSHVTVNALGEADVINILDTGIDGDDSNNADGNNDLGSFLIVNGGTENDQIILQGNGDASRVQLNGQAGRDTIEIWATATDSETEVNGGDDNDTIHVGNPNAPNRTLDPILGTICVDGGTNEIDEQREVITGATAGFIMSLGAAMNDTQTTVTIDITDFALWPFPLAPGDPPLALAADQQFLLHVGRREGTDVLDPIPGEDMRLTSVLSQSGSQVTVEVARGENGSTPTAHEPGSELVVEAFFDCPTETPSLHMLSDMQQIGDTVTMNDADQTSSRIYTLDDTTFARFDEDENPLGAIVTHQNVETFNVEAGNAEDILHVAMPGLPDVVTFDGGTPSPPPPPAAAVGDQMLITGTSGYDNISVGPLEGAVRYPFEINDVEFLGAKADNGFNDVINDTSAASQLESGDNNDTLAGGSTIDVMAVGDGGDFMASRDGNDYLFADTELGSPLPGVIRLDPVGLGDYLNGGPGSDAAFQWGRNDKVDNVEQLLDGGACKNVVTWLLASVSTIVDLQETGTPDEFASGQLNAMIAQGFGDLHFSWFGAPPVFSAPVALSSPGQNGENPFDTNVDGHVTPMDALGGINYLNVFGAGSVDDSSGGGEGETQAFLGLYDVNGDWFYSPLDVLLVVTYLNSNPSAVFSGDAEGEGPEPLVDLDALTQVLLEDQLPPANGLPHAPAIVPLAESFAEPEDPYGCDAAHSAVFTELGRSRDDQEEDQSLDLDASLLELLARDGS